MLSQWKVLNFTLILNFFTFIFGSSGVKTQGRQALVAQACNPSYSGGRDQEDHSPGK
jgi:hypothetical protein